MAAPGQHAAIHRAQRLQAARAYQVSGLGVVGDCHRDGARTILRGHARTHALACVDWRRKGGAEFGLIAGVVGNKCQAQLPQTLFGQRQRNQAARLRRHEVDRLGRGPFRRDEQIAFVLAPLVVDEYHHVTTAHGGQYLLDDVFAGFLVVAGHWTY